MTSSLLFSLPPEVHGHIFDYLDKPSLKAVRSTCNGLRDATSRKLFASVHIKRKEDAELLKESTSLDYVRHLSIDLYYFKPVEDAVLLASLVTQLPNLQSAFYGPSDLLLVKDLYTAFFTHPNLVSLTCYHVWSSSVTLKKLNASVATAIAARPQPLRIRLDGTSYRDIVPSYPQLFKRLESIAKAFNLQYESLNLFYPDPQPNASRSATKPDRKDPLPLLLKSATKISHLTTSLTTITSTLTDGAIPPLYRSSQIADLLQTVPSLTRINVHAGCSIDDPFECPSHFVRLPFDSLSRIPGFPVGLNPEDEDDLRLMSFEFGKVLMEFSPRDAETGQTKLVKLALEERWVGCVEDWDEEEGMSFDQELKLKMVQRMGECFPGLERLDLEGAQLFPFMVPSTTPFKTSPFPSAAFPALKTLYFHPHTETFGAAQIIACSPTCIEPTNSLVLAVATALARFDSALCSQTSYPQRNFLKERLLPPAGMGSLVGRWRCLARSNDTLETIVWEVKKGAEREGEELDGRLEWKVKRSDRGVEVALEKETGSLGCVCGHAQRGEATYATIFKGFPEPLFPSGFDLLPLLA